MRIRSAGFAPRQIAGAPGIDLDHFARVLDLQAGVDDRRDLDVAAGRGKLVGRGERQRRENNADEGQAKWRHWAPSGPAEAGHCVSRSG